MKLEKSPPYLGPARLFAIKVDPNIVLESKDQRRHLAFWVNTSPPPLNEDGALICASLMRHACVLDDTRWNTFEVADLRKPWLYTFETSEADAGYNKMIGFLGDVENRVRRLKG